MTKERYQELKDTLNIPPDCLDEGDGIGPAKLYDLVTELMKEANKLADLVNDSCGCIYYEPFSA